MKYLNLTPTAKVVDWARTLVAQLDRRDAEVAGDLAVISALATPWTTAAAPVTAGGGTGTTATIRYKPIGKTMFAHVRVNFGPSGGTGPIVAVTLPFTAAGTDGSTGTGDQWPLSAVETVSSGATLSAVVVGTTSTLVIRAANGGYRGGAGEALQVNGSLEVA